MGSSKEDAEATITLETAVDHSPSSKRQQCVTFERENSRQTLSEILDHEGPDRMGQTQFWTHPVLVALETIAILALLTRRLWLLEGILFVLTAYIALIVYKWVIYIICNEELRRAMHGMTAYFSIAMREAEKTVKGGTGRRMLEGSALALRGTAQSFTIRFLRQRNAALLKQTGIDMTALKQQRDIIREKFNMSLNTSLPKGLSISSNVEKLEMSLSKGLSISSKVNY